jgi:hypothetical protein
VRMVPNSLRVPLNFFILLIEVLGFPKGFSQGFNLERPSGHDNIGIYTVRLNVRLVRLNTV